MVFMETVYSVTCCEVFIVVAVTVHHTLSEVEQTLVQDGFRLPSIVQNVSQIGERNGGKV